MPQILVDGLSKRFCVAVRDPGVLGALRGIVRRRMREVSALDRVSFKLEAGELLGLMHLDGGTLVLTELGGAYAEANILARKELIAGRILRLPIISWIYDTLQRDDTHSTARSYFLDHLTGEFGDRAEKQLETAIRWGRHAELFAYNDDSGELYLED